MIPAPAMQPKTMPTAHKYTKCYQLYYNNNSIPIVSAVLLSSLSASSIAIYITFMHKLPSSNKFNILAEV